jgi:asparagine synthase (glutamine-hydrolysing)
VRTFSIGFDAAYASYADELPHAERIARQVGAEHHARRLAARDVSEFIERMVYHQDEPIGDVVCVPLYYVAKLARDAGVIVCQVGEGSDELFCGYPFWIQHLRMARYDAWPIPRFARAAALGGLSLLGRSHTYSYELLRRSVRGEPLFWGGAEGLTAREKDFVFGDRLRSIAAERSPAESLREIRSRFDANAAEPSALNWMTYLDLNLRLPELLLARVDKMTMATSVEGRVPYLDHKLIELAFSIPTRLKTQGQETKRLLKRAVRGLLPDEVLDRRKQGFGLPMREWLAGDLGKEIERRVGAFAAATGLFQPDRVREFVRTANWSKAWLLYNLAVWHERFISGDAKPPALP